MQSASQIVVVRSFGLEAATARLHSQPILNGAANHLHIPVQLVDPETLTAQAVFEGACIVFHFDDSRASNALRRIRPQLRDVVVACLCSDIYSYQIYMNVQDVADVYLAPTEAHRRLLGYVLYKPVYMLPEGIDTTIPEDHVKGLTGMTSEQTSVVNTRVTWFGYAESFAKGMASMTGEITRAIQTGAIQEFEVITNLEEFAAHDCGLDGAIRSQFLAANFFSDLRRSTYALLSHIPLDLEVNSLVKSPNKLVTCLVAGLCPICSDTTNYAEILTRFNLQRFLFSSPLHLRQIFRDLDGERDFKLIDQSGIVPWLLEEFSIAAIASKFLQIIEIVRKKPTESGFDIVADLHVPRTSSLREHLNDLLPSARRSLIARIRHYHRKRG